MAASSASMESAQVPGERIAGDHAAAGERQGLPPGPRAWPMLQTLGWALAPTWVMDRCSERLGETFTITFAPSGMKLVLFSDPEAVKSIMTAPPEVAPSATGNSPIAPVMGPSSVLVLTGPEHLRQRKLLLPPSMGRG